MTKLAERHWFAVYTSCRHEKRIARHFDQRSIEFYLPLYRTQHRWKDGSKVMLDLPLFPGYIFVRIARRQRVSVLEVPGVHSFAGASGSQLTPLPEFEVEALRSGLDPLRVEPCPTIFAGQRVCIRIGALAGIEGIVVRKKNSLRVVLTLDLLNQSIAVEVDGDDLEPVRSTSTLMQEALSGSLEQPQRFGLYEFQCLDSCPESPQASHSAALPCR